QMPVGLASSPMAAPMSLGDLAANDYPQGNVPQKKHSPFTAGNVLGVLGDALMAYGGLQPQFGPNLAHQQDEERQQGYDREKFNAQLDLARQKALEPPQWLQDAVAFHNLPDDQKQMVLDQRNAMYPAIADVQNP